MRQLFLPVRTVARAHPTYVVVALALVASACVVRSDERAALPAAAAESWIDAGVGSGDVPHEPAFRERATNLFWSAGLGPDADDGEPAPREASWAEADAHCRSVQSFAGSSAWRLPTADEVRRATVDNSGRYRVDGLAYVLDAEPRVGAWTRFTYLWTSDGGTSAATRTALLRAGTSLEQVSLRADRQVSWLCVSEGGADASIADLEGSATRREALIRATAHVVSSSAIGADGQLALPDLKSADRREILRSYVGAVRLVVGTRASLVWTVAGRDADDVLAEVLELDVGTRTGAQREACTGPKCAASAFSQIFFALDHPRKTSR